MEGSNFRCQLLDVTIALGAVNGIGLLVYWIFAKAPGFGVMAITLAEFAIGFAYGALREGFWNGQTIGKRLFHLRVIDQTGLPPGFPFSKLSNRGRDHCIAGGKGNSI